MTRDRSLGKKINTPLLCIIAIAALLRIPFLATAPISLSVDEASYGYDAYSFLETLRDRYGEFLPLFVRAFDDYRESLFMFILAPFIKILGLNEFAIRFPTALLGILTVFVLYYLAKELFNERIALFSALFLAISPWHIFFSRIAFRAILVPLLFSLALLFFLKSFNKPKYLPLSGLMFGVSLFTYPTARVFVPLFMLGLVFIFRKHLWKNRVQTAIALALFLLIFIPLFRFWITPEGMSRASETGIQFNPFIIILNYLSYFDPIFIFLKGDPNPRRSVAMLGVGELHFFELITVLTGLFFLYKAPKSKERSILLLWLFLYPIPAALIEPHHAIRSMVGAPLLSILSGYGCSSLIERVDSRRKKSFIFLTTVVVSVSVVVFLKFYFDYSQYRIAHVSRNWQYGMREAITYAENSSNHCIIVSDQFWRPNIYILFYTNYPPSAHQLSPIDPAVKSDYSLGKYYVGNISKTNKLESKCLLIIKPDEIQNLTKKGYNLQDIKLIKTPGGKETIRLVEVSR